MGDGTLAASARRLTTLAHTEDVSVTVRARTDTNLLKEEWLVAVLVASRALLRVVGAISAEWVTSRASVQRLRLIVATLAGFKADARA